jgi:hypothetical protein
VEERSAHPLLPMRTTLRTVAFWVGGVAMVALFRSCGLLLFAFFVVPPVTKCWYAGAQELGKEKEKKYTWFVIAGLSSASIEHIS